MWFFRDPTARGLTGVALVTGHAHPGLVAAIAAALLVHLALPHALAEVADD